MKREPQNNRYYLVALKTIWNNQGVTVPKEFQEKFGYLYEPLPEDHDPENPPEPVRIENPPLKDYCEEMRRRGHIDYIRETDEHMVIPLPMLSWEQWGAVSDMHTLLVSLEMLEPDSKWLLRPDEISAWISNNQEFDR